MSRYLFHFFGTINFYCNHSPQLLASNNLSILLLSQEESSLLEAPKHPLHFFQTIHFYCKYFLQAQIYVVGSAVQVKSFKDAAHKLLLSKGNDFKHYGFEIRLTSKNGKTWYILLKLNIQKRSLNTSDRQKTRTLCKSF